MTRVVLAMSGGVDSSVAAWLLRQQGHDVIGVFMRHGQQAEAACEASAPTRRKQSCCTAADAADARRVADMLEIPFYAVNFEQEFARIVDYFIAQYTAGRTPNPCIVCNTWLKFGKLFEYADSIGAEFVATGHYARLDAVGDGNLALCRGRDASKDQSYVLFGIQRQLLPRLMFPVGEYCKEEIRGSPSGWACAWRRNATARKSASCPIRTMPASFASVGATSTRRAKSSRPTARWLAVTPGSSNSRSASERACGWPSESLGTWCGSSRSRIAW